jgi:predicted enzyme involved in methoxymalonyl-ACP biosynthesis
MQYLQEIAGKSPKVQQMAQGDQLTAALFENYQKNLQMSIMQQQNKQVGRTGVTPVTDKVNQEQAQAAAEGQVQ